MILIALGANLSSRFGTPEQTISAARDALEGRGIGVLRMSSIWLSAPVPVSDQPWYRNAVLLVETDLEPLALLRALKALEVEFGRMSDERNAPRVLDLDIIAYNDELLEAEALTVPHPRAHERAFVLYPLQEIAPDWRHPMLQSDVAALIAALPEGQEIERYEGGEAA